VEGLEHLVGVVHRTGEGLGRMGLPRLDFDEGGLQARPEARQGRAQVVGDGVASVAHARHETLDPIQHSVEPGGELVVLVANAPHGRPCVKVSPFHPRDHRAETCNAARDVPAYDKTAREA
jgi:hypothetical protein